MTSAYDPFSVETDDEALDLHNLHEAGGNRSPPAPPAIPIAEPANPRQRVRDFVFTLNNPREEDPSAIIQCVHQYDFQWEAGANGTPHLQGVIVMRSGTSFRSMHKKFTQAGVRGIWLQKRRGTMQQARAYVNKADTRLREERYCNMEPYMPEAEAELPEVVDPLAAHMEHLYPYQQKVLDIISGPIDDRAIYWFYEEEGNVGKSALCKHILLKHQQEVVLLNGGSKDMFHLIAKRLAAKKWPRICLVDMPRNTKRNFLTYSGLESIKNGTFMSSKYGCDNVLMNYPHMICFANTLPLLNALSLDRWRLHRVDKETCLEYSSAEVRSFAEQQREDTARETSE